MTNQQKVILAIIITVLGVVLSFQGTKFLQKMVTHKQVSTYVSVALPPSGYEKFKEEAKIQGLKKECKKVYDKSIGLNGNHYGFIQQGRQMEALFNHSVEATTIADLTNTKSDMDGNYHKLAKLVSEAKEREARRKRTIEAIDDYLSGSPLAGHGVDFYDAAKKYGIDPRLAAAISCIESGKGRHCFRSHNAWGWGQRSWGSWHDAIWGVTAGISRGYGYRSPVSMSARYCTTNPNWGHQVQAEMEKIY